MTTRRSFLGGASSLAFSNLFSPAKAADPSQTGVTTVQHPDLILHNGRVTTLDRTNPNATAIAIKDGLFLEVGSDSEIIALAGSSTRVVDLKGKRVLPGLIDNHTHVVRGGLNYNMELRWDGVRSLADAMDMLKRQVAITPAPQWVRVVGGFTEHQFAENASPPSRKSTQSRPTRLSSSFISTTARCSTAPLFVPSDTPAIRRTRLAARLRVMPAGTHGHASRQAECRHSVFDTCEGSGSFLSTIRSTRPATSCANSTASA